MVDCARDLSRCHISEKFDALARGYVMILLSATVLRARFRAFEEAF